MKKTFLALFLCFACLFSACTPTTPPGPEGDDGDPTPPPLSVLTTVTFSIGEADATLIYTSNFALLIDTGEEEDGAEILRYMERKGISRLDALIVTHFDKDHVGGADSILREAEVGAVYQTYPSKESVDYDQYVAELNGKGITPQTVREPLSLTFGDVKLVIHPPQQESYETKESNNSSLAVHMTYGETGFLFAADAQEDRVTELVATEGLACDVLKVPYHGDPVTNLGDLLAVTRPTYGIVTCSDKNPENAAKISILRGAGVTPYLTRLGNVTCTSNGIEVTVRQ